MDASPAQPRITQARMIAIVVPVAALLGTVVALAFNSTFDESTSQVPAFQAGLARQDTGGSNAKQSPRRTRPPARPVRKRKRRAAPAAVAAAPALQPQAGTTYQSGTTYGGGTVGNVPAQTGVQSPDPKPVAPVSRPAPKPKPTPRPSGGGGGGSFDDSG